MSPMYSGKSIVQGFKDFLSSKIQETKDRESNLVFVKDFLKKLKIPDFSKFEISPSDGSNQALKERHDSRDALYGEISNVIVFFENYDKLKNKDVLQLTSDQSAMIEELRPQLQDLKMQQSLLGQLILGTNTPKHEKTLSKILNYLCNPSPGESPGVREANILLIRKGFASSDILTPRTQDLEQCQMVMSDDIFSAPNSVAQLIKRGLDKIECNPELFKFLEPQSDLQEESRLSAQP